MHLIAIVGAANNRLAHLRNKQQRGDDNAEAHRYDQAASDEFMFTLELHDVSPFVLDRVKLFVGLGSVLSDTFHTMAAIPVLRGSRNAVQVRMSRPGGRLCNGEKYEDVTLSDQFENGEQQWKLQHSKKLGPDNDGRHSSPRRCL